MTTTITTYHEPIITSLDIAEITGKNHKDIMRAIRNMEPDWVKVNGRKFALVEYVDKKGEVRPCFSINKTEFIYIISKFHDETRAKLSKRWEELELQEQERQQQSRKSGVTTMITAKGQEYFLELLLPNMAVDTSDPFVIFNNFLV